MSRLLDTSVLISFWYTKTHGDCSGKSVQDARDWAKQVAYHHGSKFIATPVVVEFLAGVRSSHELSLATAYLAEFDVVDGGEIRKEEWNVARQCAQRVPRDGKPRHLGDCLIKAIARRFNLEYYTLDKRFP